MIQASRTMSAAPLRPAFAHRPRARFFVPPEAVTSVPAVADDRRFWGLGREDFVFFAACYAAGVVFFLVMLT